MGYLVDNDFFPGCPWNLLIPRWLQFARFSQGQQAEQAGIEGPSENSHFIVLIFYISSKGHCWAVLRRSAAPRICSFGKRKPRFLLPDGPTAPREGMLSNYIYWLWLSEMILGFWLPCNILHRLGVPMRSWRGRRQCLSWPETGWERGKLLGGEWQTCRRRVFLLLKPSNSSHRFSTSWQSWRHHSLCAELSSTPASPCTTTPSWTARCRAWPSTGPRTCRTRLLETACSCMEVYQNLIKPNISLLQTSFPNWNPYIPGWGFMWETQIAKCYANSRVSTIYAGTNEIMKELIARKITRDW